MNNAVSPNDDIFLHFSLEAVPLIRSYLQSLEDTIARYGVDPSQVVSVYDGIYSYIDEFVGERPNPISFADTMMLIEQLGSPSEILAFLEPSEQVADASIATIPPVVDDGNRLRQGIINHPYMSGILGSYLLLITLNLFWEFYRDTDNNLANIIIGSFLLLIIPALVIGIIIGYIIDRIYRDGSSLEYRYNKIVDEYRRQVYTAMSIAYIIAGPLFGAIATLVSSYHWWVVTALALIFAAVAGTMPMIWYYMDRNAPQLEEVPYISLLRFKSKYSELAYSRLRKNIHRSLLPAIMLGLLWVLISAYILPPADIWTLVLTPLLIGIMTLAFAVYYQVIRAYSWDYVLEDLRRFESGELQNI